MQRLKKDYYALPEASERCGYSIDDLLWLAEHRKITLSAEAHHWPIVWGDEREFPGNSPVEGKEHIKPHFDYYNSGYLNIIWNDIGRLRKDGKLSLTEVYAEKDGREFIGSIQRGTYDFRGQQHECELELSSVFISHEDLARIENGELAGTEAKTEPKKSGTGEADDRESKTPSNNLPPKYDGRSARKQQTQYLHQGWNKKYLELKKAHPDKSDNWIANKISKIEKIAQGRSTGTIRKNMKSTKN